MKNDKNLYVVIGAQGIGKTTLCNEKYSHCFRVSQDDQGKENHKTLFHKALKEGKDVYIDRVNHTREQRERYLKPAKEAGYKTHIVVLQESYETCYNRIANRKDHPTLKIQNAHDALATFFFQYQKPKSNEADSLGFYGKDHNFLFDISKECENKRVIVVGDLHGMFDEFQELLKQCNYDKEKDIIISVGDIIDRGPKIKEAVEFFMDPNNNAYCVMGNHEYKFVRYLLGRKVNPRSLDKTTEQTKSIDKNKLIKFLMSMPYCIKFKPNSYVVHAGTNPLKHIEDQYKDELMYTRNVTLSGKSAPWWSYYYGDSEIFFGHEVTPDKVQVNDKVWALDGGACFGMELRACVYSPDGTKEFFIQKAEKAYAKYHDKYEEENDLIEKLQVSMDQVEQGRTYTWDEVKSGKEIRERENLVKEGFLNRKTYKDLFLYNYTPKTTYEKYWNHITRNSRGIIFDNKDGELVTWTPSKFFNVNEMPETFVEDLPKTDFEIFEKIDGSFVSVSYWKRGKEWIVATRGSFDSPQAIDAMKILKEKYDLNKFNKNYTYIFEYISEWNRKSEGAKLVVDYGNLRDLILLMIYDKSNI